MLLRQLLSILALPFVVAVVVPWRIVRNDAVSTALAPDLAGRLVQGGGVLLLVAGLALFAATLRRFAVDGRGTLAPWDPPRQLVIRGAYRHVRNPMITGVLFVLLGETAVARSVPLLEWAGVFLLLNVVYIPLVEEPRLRARFGTSYDEYARAVPRFRPRLRPWNQGHPQHPAPR